MSCHMCNVNSLLVNHGLLLISFNGTFYLIIRVEKKKFLIKLKKKIQEFFGSLSLSMFLYYFHFGKVVIYYGFTHIKKVNFLMKKKLIL